MTAKQKPIRMTKKIVLLMCFASATVLAGAPKYKEPPESSMPAVVTNYSQLLLCKIKGPMGPSGAHACQARVLTIDGAKVRNVAQVRLVQGKRRIRLMCVTQYGPPRTPGSYSQEFDVNFGQGEVYRAEPHWDGQVCVVRLIGADGNDLPMEPVLRPLDT